jgi:putative transposase
MLTPEQVHFGQAEWIIPRREAVLSEAWAVHPERFVSGLPKPQPLPQAAAPVGLSFLSGSAQYYIG